MESCAAQHRAVDGFIRFDHGTTRRLEAMFSRNRDIFLTVLGTVKISPMLNGSDDIAIITPRFQCLHLALILDELHVSLRGIEIVQISGPFPIPSIANVVQAMMVRDHDLAQRHLHLLAIVTVNEEIPTAITNRAAHVISVIDRIHGGLNRIFDFTQFVVFIRRTEPVESGVAHGDLKRRQIAQPRQRRALLECEVNVDKRQIVFYVRVVESPFSLHVQIPRRQLWVKMLLISVNKFRTYQRALGKTIWNKTVTALSRLRKSIQFFFPTRERTQQLGRYLNESNAAAV